MPDPESPALRPSKVSVSVAGASGYAGGELLRLLLGHPGAEVLQATSERLAGRFVRRVHPNLRGRTTLKFCSLAELEPCDVLFTALPHGESAKRMEAFGDLAKRVIDLGADFRLSAEGYERWYRRPHPRTDLLDDFAYGIVEVNRAAVREATRVACAGCNATASILALKPLCRAGVVDSVVIDVKAGSSEGGSSPKEGSHHPVRSGAVRSYKPAGHRHAGEVVEVLGLDNVHFSATAIEMVRGVLATCHVFLNRDLDDRALWRLYRQAYGTEPFVRIVKERSGVHRYPEPKILAGSNYCDVGFECDPASNRVVVISALDNLMKGAAGQAVQAFNAMHGFDETTGLEFAGLHPV